MKSSNTLLLAAKIVAILIVVAYAIGLFNTYGALQASILLVVAVVIGIDIIHLAKQAAKK
jgi:type IV secretory pathway VirB2 component (pilin)